MTGWSLDMTLTAAAAVLILGAGFSVAAQVMEPMVAAKTA